MLLHTSVASCSCHLFKFTELIANDICLQETIVLSLIHISEPTRPY